MALTCASACTFLMARYKTRANAIIRQNEVVSEATGAGHHERTTNCPLFNMLMLLFYTGIGISIICPGHKKWFEPL